MIDVLRRAVEQITERGEVRFAEFGFIEPSVAVEDRIAEGQFEPAAGVTILRRAAVSERRLRDSNPELRAAFSQGHEIKFAGGVRYVRLSSGDWERGLTLAEGTRQFADPTWGLALLGIVSSNHIRALSAPSPEGLNNAQGVRAELPLSRMRRERALQMPPLRLQASLARTFKMVRMPLAVWFASTGALMAYSHPASVADRRLVWRTVEFDYVNG